MSNQNTSRRHVNSRARAATHSQLPPHQQRPLSYHQENDINNSDVKKKKNEENHLFLI